MLAGVDVAQRRDDSITTIEKVQKNEKQVKVARMSYREVAAPLRSGVLDLRRELSHVEESMDVFRTVVSFTKQYKLFFISVCILIGIFTTIVFYIQSSTDETQDYKVIIDNEGSKTTIDSTELLKN